MANFTTDGKLCIEREIDVQKIREHEFSDLVSYFNIIDTCKWIKDNNYTKVCLQFPDDLLDVSAAICEEIKSRANIDLYILGDTSYTSCCVDSVAAMHVQGEAIIHYGHSCFTKTNIPVYTVLPKKQINIEKFEKIIEESIIEKNENKCLFYNAAYEYCKGDILNTWFQHYPESYIAFIHIGETENRFCGRVIKNASGNVFKIDILKECACFYLGFKGQTLFNFTVSVPASKWHLLNIEETKIECLEETIWFKRRRFLVEKCKDANVIGILVCKLAGDQTKDILSRMKQLCRVNGKKSYIISVGKPNVAKLANFPEIDIYVMIACPENDLYNNRDFYKPIVYPFELEIALNSNREQYYNYHITDYDDLLPGKRYHCEIDHIKEPTDVSLITGNIRETKIKSKFQDGSELAETNWALESIGQNLQNRSWKGLEQNLGETEVVKAEEGRQGIPLQYDNEPDK